ncbi:Cytochrome cd1-nitrite reductase-like C-terminal heme d1 [Penicillium samsonianum]|uniref:Cytochrome cd1-nitrite reductase-like C-terminal heme d1 n=1 Tax=Penicillium samsonianum TaxID=1882272 RepID=UPI002546C3BE|nr:Cytochrome cd1-nitrite reductase-like C-terminal heme d1 [Penicillium samsonianum]KAJ6149080.1 Cytochrome cd1-nitrite reductase-like C-terminal heme d1 [Penicillium samsonianum]
MKSFSIFFATSLFGHAALATKLYAASYAGFVTSLNFTQSNELSTLFQTTDCGSSPSWLMLDSPNSVLYCLDEAIDAPNGTISTLRTHPDGTLTKLAQLKTPAGPVMSAMYSAPGVQERKFFVAAHYSGSSVTTYSVNPVKGLFQHEQTFTYQMAAPGPVASRQDSPHPHGVVVDPTGRFVLVPDLGADVVRVFYVNPSTGLLEPIEPLAMTPGSGPRHGVFWTPRGSNSRSEDVYFYLVQELSNDLIGFRVAYSGNGISFRKIYEGSTYGNGSSPAGSKVAEIAISPENNHIVVSNRLDNTFGPKKDSFAVFRCADASGKKAEKVSFLGLYPAYGSSPRQFSIASTQTMVAVALESSQSVAVARWDKRSGAPGTLLGEMKLDGDIPSVVWDL